MATFNKFNCFVQDLAHAVHDMKSGTPHVYKVYLSSAVPSAGNTVYNVPADLAAGNGYASGGASIGTIAGAQVAGVFRLIAGTQPSWTATGGSIGPFQYAVLYNATAAGQPLIGWWDYGVPVTLTNGNAFTLATDPVNGILTIT